MRRDNFKFTFWNILEIKCSTIIYPKNYSVLVEMNCRTIRICVIKKKKQTCELFNTNKKRSQL